MGILRAAIRTVLVLAVLGGISWVCYQAWVRNQPDYYWNRAQKSIESGDQQEAKVHLRNLLQRSPKHAEGHAAMASLLLQEARKDAPNVSYARHPAAMQHLAAAAPPRAALPGTAPPRGCVAP